MIFNRLFQTLFRYKRGAYNYISHRISYPQARDGRWGNNMIREKILLVEDEQGIRELIQLYLENRKYIVLPAENGRKALHVTEAQLPDLVLLDIEMPGLDGFEVCKKIRAISDIPIIFISSRRDVLNKIKCFELGGDDYITKPFDFSELEARVRANLRRYQDGQQKQNSNMLSHGDLEIHLDSYECYKNKEPIILSTKEMQVLILLAKRPNYVYSAEQIYDQIWGFESTGDIQAVKVHISNLRRKLEEDTTNPRYIKTVRGFGYRFVIE